MATRQTDDSIWIADDDFRKLPPAAKALYFWSYTNPHVDAPGLYRVSPETISFETGIPLNNLPELFAMVKKFVSWYPDQGLVWFKDFFITQNNNPSYRARGRTKLEALAKYCKNGLCDEVLAYNIYLGIEIPLSDKDKSGTIAGKYSPGEAISILRGDISGYTDQELNRIKTDLTKKGYKNI